VGRQVELAALHTALEQAHLPLLVEPEEQEQLHRQTQGLPPERMLRQLIEALTVITRERLVVLVLEDLQWSDPATVEALAYLARCPEPVRLLVLGTYRPAEVIAWAVNGYRVHRQTPISRVCPSNRGEIGCALSVRCAGDHHLSRSDESVATPSRSRGANAGSSPRRRPSRA
jgi:AAA ATPase domain